MKSSLRSKNSRKENKEHVLLVGPLTERAEVELFQKSIEQISREKLFIVALDAGLKVTQKLKIIPDLAIGDWDSLGRTPSSNEAIVVYSLDTHKNMSDLRAAFDYLSENKIFKRFSCLHIFGLQGMRMDHEIAILDDIKSVAKKIKRMTWYGTRASVFFLKKGEKAYASNIHGRRLSVFPFATPKARVTLKGVSYPLNKQWLELGSLGLSNSVDKNKFSIEVLEHQVMVLFDRVESPTKDHVNLNFEG